MFERNDAAEIAWLISTIYQAAIEDDRIEATNMFNAIMKALIKDVK